MPDPAKVLQLECQGRLDDIRCTLRDLDSYLDGFPVPRDWADDLALILAEVLTNIARHGYPDKPGKIEVRLMQAEEVLECQITDQGISFNPSSLGRTAPDPSEFSEGGYGWFIIRSLAHHLRYDREGGNNVLRFRIPFRTVQ